ncbi:MAG: DUF883 C-terminal domain-containing protein [Gammaproteobacteria bacterium]|nr:DUF883 C-terminal domain-containing protein [Gammaproteobacteria bacterium]
MYTKEIKGKVQEATDDVSHAAHKAREVTEEMFQESWKTLQAKSSDLQENVVTYVKENPLKALGFAAIAGLLLAQLMRK